MGRSNTEESNPEYGEPAKFDPTFNGPIRNRSCTDIICCVLFMLFIVGYMVVGILAWLYGDPRQVLYPRNSTGMFCGVGVNKDKPSVLYFDLLKCTTATNIMAAALNGLQCPTTQVCVQNCPSQFWLLSPLAYAPGAKPKDFFEQQYCVPTINLASTTLSVQDIVNKELCPVFYIPTSSVLGRCLPSIGLLNSIPTNFTLPGMASQNDTANAIINATSDVVQSFNAREIGVRIFEDFATSWYWILIGLLIAMLLSLLFLLLLRFMAPVLIWLLIVGVLAVVAYGIWHCYWEYNNYKNSSATISTIGFTANFSAYLQVKETWLAFLIILCIVEAVLLLLLLFLRTRILIAIALIQESSRAVGHMMSTLVYPLITFVLLVVCIAYWGVTALYLATSGPPVYKVVALNSSSPGCKSINGTETCDPLSFSPTNYTSCPSAQCIFINYSNEGLFQRNLFNLQIYNVLGLLWCVNFVIALGQCTLAGAFASYYWAFSKPSDIPAFPLCQSFIRTLRYHVGSLAFGALILTLVQLIRIVLEYLDHKFRAAQNPCTRFIMCCLKCCFWCLEKFIKFLNRNAYIMIAIYGKNFCVSAKNAFMLLMRNIVRVVVLDKVTDLLLLFGKLLVVGGVGVLAFFFFSGRIKLPGNTFQAEMLNYYWVPITTVIVGAYLITQGFFSVYSMCVDTLFLCFCEYHCDRRLQHASPSDTEQPEEEDYGHEQEERVLPVAIVGVTVAVVIGRVLRIGSVKRVVGVEDGGKEAEWKSTDPEGHVEARVPKALERPSTVWLCSLTLRSRRGLQPGILLAGAAPPIQGNDLLPADASLAHRTLLSARTRLQPLVKTRPAEQVSAQADHRVPCRVQADVALEGGPVGLPLPFAAAAASSSCAAALVAVFSGRESSPAGRSAVTRAPRIRGRHVCLRKELAADARATRPSDSGESDPVGHSFRFRFRKPEGRASQKVKAEGGIRTVNNAIYCLVRILREGLLRLRWHFGSVVNTIASHLPVSWGRLYYL